MEKTKLKRTVSLFLAIQFVLFLTSTFLLSFNAAQAETIPLIVRLAGADRYKTAVQISQAGWFNSDTVVIARGDDFPDALAGSVLARSPKAGGPMLLTDSKYLSDDTLAELGRLNARKVYVLGGTGAVSAAVESSLTTAGYNTKRISGISRYETAANISLEAFSSAQRAFLVSGQSYADALSISSYAAANGIPILLTDRNTLPEATAKALESLGVTSLTIIGGTGVISGTLEEQLKVKYNVDRLAGSDRYQTNLAVLNSPQQKMDSSKVFVATGENFPDAMTGAVLASLNNNPIIMVGQTVAPDALSYLNTQRAAGSSFTILGGWGVVSYGVESIVRTGSLSPRVSLQYIQASKYEGMLDQLNVIPGNATDSVDYVSPNWFTLTGADGSFTGSLDNTPYYNQFVAQAHSKNLKVLPLINSSWESTSVIDGVLTNSTSRTALIDRLVQMVQNTGSDGLVVDFEWINQANGPYLTQFMRELYSRLHPLNKFVVMAVMARTSASSWTVFNYYDLSQTVDYLNIMTYDYSMSSAGPIAPISWVRSVLDYAKAQHVDMGKVLLGIPYYGRDWGTGKPQAVGLAGATGLAAAFGSAIQREYSSGDTVGIPYFTYLFTYLDGTGTLHKVYFDDRASWEAKLTLLDQYGLGGIGAWSLYWVNKDTASQLFPLLQAHLR